jgi:hypothetical protein
VTNGSPQPFFTEVGPGKFLLGLSYSIGVVNYTAFKLSNKSTLSGATRCWTIPEDSGRASTEPMPRRLSDGFITSLPGAPHALKSDSISRRDRRRMTMARAGISSLSTGTSSSGSHGFETTDNGSAKIMAPPSSSTIDGLLRWPAHTISQSAIDLPSEPFVQQCPSSP